MDKPREYDSSVVKKKQEEEEAIEISEILYAGTWIETSRHLNLISLTSRKSWGDQPERAPPCLAAPSLPTAAQNELHPSISFQTAKSSLLLPASKFLLAPRPTTTSPRLLGSRLERAGLPFLSPGPGPASPRLARSAVSLVLGCVILWLWADGWTYGAREGAVALEGTPRFLAVSSSLAWVFLLVDVTMAQTAYSSRRLTDRIRGHARVADPLWPHASAGR